MLSLSLAPIKIVAKYAKLGRSLYKKYSKLITSSTLRLGLVSKDPRGFDMTKWHHLDCFPSDSVSSAEAITGFSSFKESLKKLVNEGARASEKVNKMDENEDDKLEQGNLKKQKLHTSEERTKLPLEITMSASDIKDKYKDAILSPKWKAFQTIIFLERVIFTNESNIERWKNKRQATVDSKIERLENFSKLVKVFIACGFSSGQPEDLFRKPKPGMWKIMEKEFNSGLPVDMDQSFYVGDAAGSPDDHSDADKNFAEAIGLKFYVPAEYFIGSD